MGEPACDPMSEAIEAARATQARVLLNLLSFRPADCVHSLSISLRINISVISSIHKTSTTKKVKGIVRPRPSSRIAQRLPDRVIYLLENGANFPSNIVEKVYERFTQDNMEKAQVKIVRELKSFGILKTAGIRK